ncbi:ABC transporter substrate-binding protein [Frankia sp. AgB1.9]|uniref:ABC transporter substrate-binding protein n=1 Tax=unclassified Frankia TaxID=2632575 RepID=UPI0019311DFB|nr:MULTISPECIES: ABC transporter substrate-binding protein [unclassified Frankia]MBL7493363.1 ABC transporter substrate-binding protein [Frankia sp. AgW1.1]MBL7550757.1 ABC transporter substrate-binding protein [Frankia sp. AgB1.9]MBL7622589.1 ABC transporter substrate-binding protein [Frankia sp. AgB1.8]
MAAGLAALLALVGCAGSAGPAATASTTPAGVATVLPTDKPGGTLRVVTDAMPTGDPGWAVTTADRAFARLVSRTLYSYPASADVDSAVVARPDLAVSAPQRSPNGLVITVRLSSAARWDTPTPRRIVANDVARGLKRLCLPPTPSPLRGYFAATIVGFNAYCTELFTKPLDQLKDFIENQSPAGIQVVSNTDIAFHLIRPYTDFVDLLALPEAAPVPVEADDYQPNSPDYLNHLISDGPYHVTSSADGVYSLGKDGQWNRAIDGIRQALPDHITITSGVTAADAQSQIEAGKADITLDSAVPLDRATALFKAADPRLSVPTTGSDLFLTVGMHGPAGAALSDQDVRDALATCVDRIAVVEALGDPPFASAASQLLQPTMTGYSPLDPFPTQDGAGDATTCGDGLAKAPDGPVTELTLLTTDTATDAAVAGALVETFAKVGVKLVVDAKAQSDFDAAAVSPLQQSWDLALTTVTPLWYGDAGRTVFQPLFDPTWVGQRPVDGGYDAKEVLDTMSVALQAPTPASRAAAWGVLESTVLRDVAVIPLAVLYEPRFRSSSVLSFNQVPSVGTVDLTDLALGPA